jgi:hypothetical protein
VVDATNCYADGSPRPLGAGPRPRAGFQPCAREDLDPGRGWAHIHNGVARLCVEVHRAPLGAYSPDVALHRGEQRHTAGAQGWVCARRGVAGACDREVEPRLIFPRLCHPSSALPTNLYGSGHEDIAAGGDAFDG